MERELVATEATGGTSERKRLPRYRSSTPIVVRTADVPEARGMCVEINESGMSAVIGADLKVGDKVELEPVGGGNATAVVRRSMGKIYGLEFINLTSQQAEKIRAACKVLPLYRSKTLDLWKR